MGTIAELNEVLGTNFRSFNKVKFYEIAMDYQLSERTIVKFADKWNWLYVVRYQTLSENLIRENLFRMGHVLHDILECQVVSKELREEIEQLIKEQEKKK